MNFNLGSSSPASLMEEMEPMSLRICHDGLPGFPRDVISPSLISTHSGEARATRTRRLLCSWRNSSCLLEG